MVGGRSWAGSDPGGDASPERDILCSRRGRRGRFHGGRAGDEAVHGAADGGAQRFSRFAGEGRGDAIAGPLMQDKPDLLVDPPLVRGPPDKRGEVGRHTAVQAGESARLAPAPLQRLEHAVDLRVCVGEKILVPRFLVRRDRDRVLQVVLLGSHQHIRGPVGPVHSQVDRKSIRDERP